MPKMNERADVIMGAGGVQGSLNGKPYPFATYGCGAFRNATTLVVSQSPSALLATWAIGTATVAPVDPPASANQIAGGGDQWVALGTFPGSRDSYLFGTIPNLRYAGGGDVADDGTIAFKSVYQSNSGVTIIPPGSSRPAWVNWPTEVPHDWISVPNAVAPYDLQALPGGKAIWRGGGHGRPAPRPFFADAMSLKLVTTVDGTDWLAYWSNALPGLILQPDGASEGFVLEQRGVAFNHDAIALGNDVIVASSWTQAEGPNDLVKLRANRQGVEFLIDVDRSRVVPAWRSFVRDPVKPPEPPPPVYAPPKVTITSYEPRTGPPPLAVRAVYVTEAGSGPITELHWQRRQSAAGSWIDDAVKPPSEIDHHYRFAQAGDYELRLLATGPGGQGATGLRRSVTVTAASASNTQPPPVQPLPIQPTDVLIYLRTVDGVHRLSARIDEPSVPVTAEANGDGPYEAFVARFRSDGRVGFRSTMNHRWMSAQPDGTVVCDRERPDDFVPDAWEAFTLKDMGDGNVALQTAHGKWTCATGGGGGTVIADRPEPAAWETFKSSVPLVRGRGTRAIAGRVRMVQGRFQNDAGWWPWRVVSDLSGPAYLLTGRESQLAQRLDVYAQGGRTGVRMCGMIGTWRPQDRYSPRTPGYWDALAQVYDLCAARGLYLELCLFADAQVLVPDNGERAQWLDRFADFIASRPGVIPQVANEPFKNGWSSATDPQLTDLAERLAARLGHRDFSLGDPEDGDDVDASAETTAALVQLSQRSNLVVLHSSRMSAPDRWRRWVDHLGGVTTVFPQLRSGVAFSQDEPMGAGAQMQDGRRDNDPDAFVAAHLTSLCCAQGFTYHWIVDESLTVDQLPGFAVVAPWIDRVPVSPDWRYCNDSWPGSPTAGVKVVGKPGKIRNLVNGSHFWTVAYGELDFDSIVWRMTPTELVYDGQRCKVWCG